MLEFGVDSVETIEKSLSSNFRFVVLGAATGESKMLAAGGLGAGAFFRREMVLVSEDVDPWKEGGPAEPREVRGTGRGSWPSPILEGRYLYFNMVI